MSSVSASSIGQDGWEQLFEEIVPLEDGATTVGRKIDDQLCFTHFRCSFNEVGINILEWNLIDSITDECSNDQDCYIFISWCIDEVTSIGVLEFGNKGSGIAWCRICG